MTPQQLAALTAADMALAAGNASLAALTEAVRVLRESLYDPVPPPPPPADPLPPTPPKTRLQPDLTNAPEPAQYLLDDGGAGPSYRHWSTHLSLPWRTQDVGDWTDAAGASNGRAPYASAAITGPGAVEIDVTDLARSLQTDNTGIRVLCVGAVEYAARKSATPPRLVVYTAAGAVECPCTSTPAWVRRTASQMPMASRSTVSVAHPNSHAALQFDMSGVADRIDAAVLNLTVTRRWGSAARIELYRMDLPRIQIGAGRMTPQLGLAAEVGEVGLRGHPDVMMAGDFAGTTFDHAQARAKAPLLFDRINYHVDTKPEALPDADAPGTVMWRGSFTPVGGRDDPRRLSFDGTYRMQNPDMTDPLRPAMSPTLEAYFRLYVYLEDDFGTAHDGNKMGITWDLRLGWWAEAGYWQNLTGNGGTRGDGRKWVRSVPGQPTRAAYNGHMLRMECGQATPLPDCAYSDLRPLLGYNYHIDQGGPFPGGAADELGGPAYSSIVPAVLARGRWHCLEQYIRLNSIDTTTVDAMGNGEARPDGVLTTWLDGIKVDHRDGYRWRRHPDMGIGGVNTNWWLGGGTPSAKPMHYRINHLALAKRYIGPRVA